MTRTPADPPSMTGNERIPAVLMFRGLDAEALLAGQMQASQALAAAARTFLYGMQEVSLRQLTLFSTMTQQYLDNFASILQANNPGDATDRQARAARNVMDATLESMREVMNAACKCNLDALAAFHEGLGQSSGARCAPEPRT